MVNPILPMPPDDGARYRCDFLIRLKSWPFAERCDNTATIHYQDGKGMKYLRCDEHNDLADD